MFDSLWALQDGLRDLVVALQARPDADIAFQILTKQPDGKPEWEPYISMREWVLGEPPLFIDLEAENNGADTETNVADGDETHALETDETKFADVLFELAEDLTALPTTPKTRRARP